MFKIFKKRNKKLSKNIITFINMIEEDTYKEMKKPLGERNIHPVSIDAQLVVDCLCDLFLGDDWNIVDPLTTGQVNAIILDNILYKHCPEYKKYIELKKECSKICQY